MEILPLTLNRTNLQLMLPTPGNFHLHLPVQLLVVLFTRTSFLLAIWKMSVQGCLLRPTYPYIIIKSWRSKGLQAPGSVLDLIFPISDPRYLTAVYPLTAISFPPTFALVHLLQWI